MGPVLQVSGSQPKTIHIPTFHLRGLKGPLSPGREKRAGKSQISICATLKMILTVIYEQGQIATGTVS